MKTPEEWLEEPSYAAWTATREDIAAIQADAREGMVPAAELRSTIAFLRELSEAFKSINFQNTAEMAKVELARLETLLGEKPDGQ